MRDENEDRGGWLEDKDDTGDEENLKTSGMTLTT